MTWQRTTVQWRSLDSLPRLLQRDWCNRMTRRVCRLVDKGFRWLLQVRHVSSGRRLASSNSSRRPSRKPSNRLLRTSNHEPLARRAEHREVQSPTGTASLRRPMSVGLGLPRRSCQQTGTSLAPALRERRKRRGRRESALVRPNVRVNRPAEAGTVRPG